jgi:prepilin-type N-terminal cleavage/methylation domain-containing protein
VKKSGFTLMEILITIAIIGILASLVVPQLTGHIERSRSAEARNMMGAIREAEEAFFNGPAGIFLDLNTDSNGNSSCEDGEGTPANAWNAIGIADPNLNPNRYFGYCVDATTNGPTQFQVIATRLGTSNYIGLNQNGVWSGTYEYAPENPGGYVCDPTVELC